MHGVKVKWTTMSHLIRVNFNFKSELAQLTVELSINTNVCSRFELLKCKCIYVLVMMIINSIDRQRRPACCQLHSCIASIRSNYN
jgi:hypothetical protein